MVGPKAKRRALEVVREKFGLSIRQSCRILGLRQSTYHYRPKRVRDDSELRAKILEVVAKKPSYGKAMVVWRLRERMGIKDNHKRIGPHLPRTWASDAQAPQIAQDHEAQDAA